MGIIRSFSTGSPLYVWSGDALSDYRSKKKIVYLSNEYLYSYFSSERIWEISNGRVLNNRRRVLYYFIGAIAYDYRSHLRVAEVRGNTFYKDSFSDTRPIFRFDGEIPLAILLYCYKELKS